MRPVRTPVFERAPVPSNSDPHAARSRPATLLGDLKVGDRFLFQSGANLGYPGIVLETSPEGVTIRLFKRGYPRKGPKAQIEVWSTQTRVHRA